MVVLSMSRLNRLLALTFIFLVLSSLLVLSVVPVTAQVVNKPSVPQFSVECVNQPYDVPPTTSKPAASAQGKASTSKLPGVLIELYMA